MNVDFSKTPIYNKVIEHVKYLSEKNKDHRLTPEERTRRYLIIINERFINGKTLKHCAELVGVSTERFRTIEQKLIRQLRWVGFTKTLGTLGQKLK